MRKVLLYLFGKLYKDSKPLKPIIFILSTFSKLQINIYFEIQLFNNHFVPRRLMKVPNTYIYTFYAWEEIQDILNIFK